MTGAHHRSIFPKVHLRGTVEKVDRVFDLVRFVTKPQPLADCLDALPAHIAAVLDAPVCSIYVRQGQELAMRGNVGFPRHALSDIRLHIGEGITGMAVECMRPITAEAAPRHANYRHFPSLGEEHFPYFLAVPVAGARGPLGALVVQRREPPPFTEVEIQLAIAITAPISAVIERAHLVHSLSARTKPAASSRRVTLAGRSHIRERGFGRVVLSHRPTPSGKAKVGRSESSRSRIEDNAGRLERAVAEIRRVVEEQRELAKARGLDHTPLDTVFTILDDGRIRQLTVDLLHRGSTLSAALTTAAAEAARAAARGGDDFAIDRARTINDVCEALAGIVEMLPDQIPKAKGTVLAADRFTLLDWIVCRSRPPAAVILRSSVENSLSALLLALIDKPTVVDIESLYRWIHEGDLVLVDADHGLVRLNPSRAEIAATREHQRQE